MKPSTNLTDRFPAASEALKQARKEHLHHLSHNELERMSRSVHAILRDDAVADDAFSHAMLVAWHKYDGSIPLFNYVLIVARNYAVSQYRRASSKDLSFAELEDEDGEVNLPAVAVDDPLISVDDPFDLSEYEYLSNVLLGVACVGSASEQRTARRAHRVLERFIQSARADRGMGVDEYDQTELMSGNKRTLLNGHLRNFLSEAEDSPVGTKTVEAAMTVLRQTTRAVAKSTTAQQYAEKYARE